MGFDIGRLTGLPVSFLYFSVKSFQNGLFGLFFSGLFFYNF